MRGRALAIALATAGLCAPAAASAPTQAILPLETMVAEKREKQMRKAVAAGMLAKVRRSRGPQAKPNRHSNRLHTSKRVRRKHRRAA